MLPGVGKVHAKYNPAATVYMRYEPEIRLNYDLLDRVSAKDKALFVKQTQPGVFKYDESTDQLTLENAHKVRGKPACLIVSFNNVFLSCAVCVAFILRSCRLPTSTRLENWEW